MGICYIASDVPIPHYRGASTHVLELSRALSKLGNRVHVICRRGQGEPSSEEIDGVTFHRVFRGMIGPLPSGGYADADSDDASDSLPSRVYRVYLQTLHALYTGELASRIIRSSGLNVIIERETAYGAGAVASIISHRPLILEMIGPRFSPLSMTMSSSVLAYNELMVPRSALSKTVFVKAAVNLEIFRPDQEGRRRTRERLNIGSSVVLGYVGTFQSWHGIEEILSAAVRLVDRGLDTKFLMVGPHHEKTMALARDAGLQESMIFTGPVPYERVADYINASDIMLAPYNILRSSRRTKGIGSPLKVLEYMACGKPTIGSSLPQVAEIIDDGRTGLLVPQGGAEHLADRIAELVGNPELQEMIGRNALEKVRGESSWLSFARRIQPLLEECVNARAG